MFVSVLSRPGVRYPGAGAGFSPDESYPEYRLGHVSDAPNPVYAQTRELLAQAGLDERNFGSDAWNPLRALVPEGARVFVLCNFVRHRRPKEPEDAFHAKCIHGSVLRALLDYVLLATGPEGRVQFGNAPLQSCDWQAVQQETGAAQVARFYAERALPVEPVDLRLLVTERDASGRTRTRENRDPSAAVEIDLAADSLLEEVCGSRAGRSNLRVTDYDPRGTEACHRDGTHLYVVHRDVLESDVVISLPKLKTHEKVGITCGVKGFVGAVGHKDCLAHHRFGSPRIGGDEYPTRQSALRALSALHDWIYRRDPDSALQGLAQTADRILRTAARSAGAITAGAWHGNDTAWRMALDLAMILRYADAAGVLQDEPQRRHFSLIDGIVAGEGDGPLDPRPVRAGTLILSDDVALADRIACRLMGFDSEVIPVVRENFARRERPLSDCAGASVVCRVNGVDVEEVSLGPVAGRPFVPPRGWRGHLGDG